MDPKNPRPIGPAYADCLSGMFSALGVLGALVARTSTGKGQQVDATMVGSILAFLNAPATETLAHGRVPGPYTRPRQSQTYAFSCSDGAMLAIHLSSPQKFWEGLCNSVGHPEMIEDPRFKTRPDRRSKLRRAEQNFRGIFQRKAACPLDGTARSQRRAPHAGLQLEGSLRGPAGQTHGHADSHRAEKQADDQNCEVSFDI